MRLPHLTALVLVLSAASQAQKFRFSPLPESVVEARAQHAPARDDRKAKIKELFLQAGCRQDDVTEQESGNVICRLAGGSKQTIIVGANYGQAAPDNWTGVALLPSIFQTLVARKRHHTFLFVAFADGSHDVAGSDFFAKQMFPVQAEQTEAMINLDALGYSPTKISPTGSDKKLVESFFTVTYTLKQMASQVDISRAVHVDSEPFASLGVPGITIHSLTQDAVAGLQDPPIVAIAAQAGSEVEFRSDFYYKSYRLISGYLAFLDETLKPRKSR